MDEDLLRCCYLIMLVMYLVRFMQCVFQNTAIFFSVSLSVSVYVHKCTKEGYGCRLSLLVLNFILASFLTYLFLFVKEKDIMQSV